MSKQISRVLFVGSKRLGLQVLTEMVKVSPGSVSAIVTIDDRSDTRGYLAEFQAFAKAASIPLHIAKNRTHSEQLFQELRPELCFVCGWYWLISAECLKAVACDFIGIHNSILPEYRGAAPLVWGVINGETRVGFSLFSFTEGMDDGPVWAIGEVIVEADDFINEILLKLEEEAVRIIREIFPKILTGDVRPLEQEHSRATFSAARKAEDGFIDWKAPADAVFNFIRAQSDPYPGAYTLHEGKVLRIFGAKRFAATFFGTPGQVARLTPDGVYVVCGDNKVIILTEVEYDSKRMAAQEVLKSLKVRFPLVLPTELNNA